MKFVILVIALLYSFGTKAVDDISRDYIEITLKLINENVVVGFSWVDLPLDQILLLNHKESFCAIKFNSFKRLYDSKEATTSRSSAETFLASYSKYEFTELNGSVELDKVTNHKLVSEATVGVGRLTFGGGDKKIECGNGFFYWEYPTAVFVTRDNKYLRFYPTLLNDFVKLKNLSSTVQWTGYEENRPKKIIGLQSIDD